MHYKLLANDCISIFSFRLTKPLPFQQKMCCFPSHQQKPRTFDLDFFSWHLGKGRETIDIKKLLTNPVLSMDEVKLMKNCNPTYLLNPCHINLYSLLRLTCRWLRSFCWLCGGGCTWTTRCLVKGKSQIDTTKAPECYKWMQVPLVAVCKLVYPIYMYTYICTMYMFILCARYIHTWMMAISYTNVYIYTL